MNSLRNTFRHSHMLCKRKDRVQLIASVGGKSKDLPNQRCRTMSPELQQQPAHQSEHRTSLQFLRDENPLQFPLHWEQSNSDKKKPLRNCSSLHLHPCGRLGKQPSNNRLKAIMNYPPSAQDHDQSQRSIIDSHIRHLMPSLPCSQDQVLMLRLNRNTSQGRLLLRTKAPRALRIK